MAAEATLERLQAEFDSPAEHIHAAVALFEASAPPAFVARYRRWQVGDMPEERLHAIAERLHHLSEQEQRKQAIAQQTRERGTWTEELQQVLDGSADQDLIDDLYQSLRPRRRTAAMQMEEKGLDALALAIQHRQLGAMTLQEAAAEYVSEERGLPTVEAVLEGVLLILAERIGGDPWTRARCRDELRGGILRARAVNPGHGSAERYRQFFEFSEPIGRIAPARMLALRRAEREGILQLELGLDEGRHREVLRELHGRDLEPGTALADFYDLVFDHAWQHGLREVCGRDVRRRIKEKADREAVRTYARNLRSQLLSPPLGAKKVLALRTSSKTVWFALLAEDGSVLQHGTLPTHDDEQRTAAFGQLQAMIAEHRPAALAVPHGRRQAGTEKVVEQLRTAVGAAELPMVVPVDEAASAIYATSQHGRRALPGVEVGVRTAISLGRRLQDPLRELLRMDFRALGLGQTLDDVHQGMLRRELDAVVAQCVAAVGVDLNTCDADELAQVPGIGPDRAKAILEHRRRIGGFRSRAQLAEVPGLDPEVCRHIAGFLLVQGGTEPLDGTALHPDDYELARAIAQHRNQPVEELFGQDLRDVPLDAFEGPGVTRGRVLGVVQALRHAGRDVRGVLTPTVNAGVHALADLRPDLELRGRVANLTEFGAFVDLGIGQDGLVHISQIPPHRLRDPQHMLRVGEVVQVWVLHVDADARKISLTMHKPRHLAEGRQPTLGERLERGMRRRRERGGPPERGRHERGGPQRGGPERGRPQPTVFSRAARAPESRRGQRRRPPLSAEGKPEPAGREAGEGGARPPRGPAGDRHEGRRPRFGDRGERHDRGERGDRPGRDPRVITVESERAIEHTKGHKGEFTSLAGLRALLAGERSPAQDAGRQQPPEQQPPETRPQSAPPADPPPPASEAAPPGS